MLITIQIWDIQSNLSFVINFALQSSAKYNINFKNVEDILRDSCAMYIQLVRNHCPENNQLNLLEFSRSQQTFHLFV